jgi:hypothetical protein
MDEKANTKPINLILDSGAFSAWMKQSEINLDEYIQFCLENLDVISYVVNLDVIPGKFGQKNLPPEEIERSASKGYENYLYMINHGIPKEKLIHVFHQGESFKWLKKMIREIPYIGLSPANDRTTPEKMMWLDNCMPIVTDSSGLPIVKFHGFAVTSLRLMLRYPWYSVDSTSWVMTGRMGSVLVPKFRQGRYDYMIDPFKVAVSDRSPNNKEAGKHFRTFAPVEQEIIQQYLAHKGYRIGYSEFRLETKSYKPADGERWFGPARADGLREVELVVEPGLANDYMQRDELNIVYFLDLEAALPGWPWAFKLKTDHAVKGGFGL